MRGFRANPHTRFRPASARWLAVMPLVAALALGARGCLVGRAFLYGLMAGGERGVVRATEILSSEITRTLQLLGVPAVDELTGEHATLRAR